MSGVPARAVGRARGRPPLHRVALFPALWLTPPGGDTMLIVGIVGGIILLVVILNAINIVLLALGRRR